MRASSGIAFGLLRRHVGRSAYSRAGGGEIHCPGSPRGLVSGVEVARIRGGLEALLLGQTEIENLELLAVPATVDHEQVGRLDIPMHDTPGVGRRQSACCLLAEGQYLRWREAVVSEIQFERLAAKQLHDQVGLSVLFAYIVNGTDVGVVQCGRCPGFAQETLMGKVHARVGSAGGRRTAGARIGDEKAVGYELESDFAFESCVQGAVDVTHTAGADLFDDSVGPKDSASSDHWRPRR